MKFYFRILTLIILLSCEETEPVNICDEVNMIVTLNKTSSGCNSINGSAQVNVEGGNPPYLITLNQGEPSTNTIFKELSQGNYNFMVEDAKGCLSENHSFEILTGISLTTDILPIINTSCNVGNCHQLIGPSFQTNEEIISTAEAIKVSVNEGTMPPETEPPLEQNQIDLINCWVNDGAPEN